MNYLYTLGIIFMALTAGCEKSQEDFIQGHLHTLLTIKKPVEDVPADGISKIKVIATFAENVDKRNITFSCSGCKFSQNGLDSIILSAVQIGDMLEAEVTLNPSLQVIKDMIVTCKAGEFNDTVHVNYDTAFAEFCLIEAQEDTIKSLYQSTLPVSIYLTRNIGTPSLGQKVKLWAVKADSSPIGDFREVSIKGSDSSGLISAKFELRDTSYNGEIYLIAQTVNSHPTKPDSFKILVFQ